MKKYVVDTNFILRYLLNDNEAMFKEAKFFFDCIKLGKTKAYLEQTVFTETIFVLSKFYKVPRPEVSRVLRNLLLYKGILNSEKEVLLEGLKLYESTELHIVDCIIAVKAKQMNIEVATFDEELKGALHVQVI